MIVQDSNPHEDDFNNLETTENSVYTDDYQTEDAFSQIPVLNEFVEEETISTLEKEIGNVVCFMGCADNSHLIEGFEEILKK